MFFENVAQIPTIATKVNCSIFVLPESQFEQVKLPFALTLMPDPSKKTPQITIDQIREFSANTQSKETKDRFFVIAPADAMSIEAQNAFLKTFEEPGAFCHFVLLTENPNKILPTILSRAQIFFLKQPNYLEQPPNPKNLAIAKQLVSAKPQDLPAIAEKLAKVKNQPRANVMEITATAIDLLHKSYYKTKNPQFLNKLPKFIKLYDSLEKNGHIKLHIVADLI